MCRNGTNGINCICMIWRPSIVSFRIYGLIDFFRGKKREKNNLGSHLPLKTASTVRKYTPIGPAIIATVKARSLKMTSLLFINIQLSLNKIIGNAYLPSPLNLELGIGYIRTSCMGTCDSTNKIGDWEKAAHDFGSQASTRLNLRGHCRRYI